jgi:hypothetical protein
MMRAQLRTRKDEVTAYREGVVKVWEKCAPNR